MESKVRWKQKKNFFSTSNPPTLIHSRRISHHFHVFVVFPCSLCVRSERISCEMKAGEIIELSRVEGVHTFELFFFLLANNNRAAVISLSTDV